MSIMTYLNEPRLTDFIPKVWKYFTFKFHCVAHKDTRLYSMIEQRDYYWKLLVASSALFSRLFIDLYSLFPTFIFK